MTRCSHCKVYIEFGSVCDDCMTEFLTDDYLDGDYILTNERGYD